MTKPTDDLIDLMREYGVEVHMLGTDEDAEPSSTAMCDMLTEIHTLRSRISAERQPVQAIDDLYEKLAAIEHARWADWQRYMHSQCVVNDDGSLTIPPSLVTHWERQIATPYDDLSEHEKQSDRDQVSRYWPLLAALNEAIAAAKESDHE
jgi:hypothetical protein